MKLEQALKRCLPNTNVIIISSYGEIICEGYPDNLLTEHCILNRVVVTQSDSPYGHRVIQVQTAHPM